MKVRHLLVLLALVAASAPCARANPLLISDLVSQVSQTQYTDFQLTVESMGLGLYGGSAYNQGYRGRDASSTGGTDALGNQECRLYLQDQFQAMGLATSVQGTYRNVVAELTGTDDPEQVLIIGGHYDHIGGVPRPGGDDNASGTAGVLEVARILSQYSFRYTIRFIAFNAEEDGLKGSADYVNNVLKTSSDTVLGMISLDMILRPYNDTYPTLPIDLDLGCPNSADDLAWVGTFTAAVSTYVPSLTIDAASPYTSSWGYSDHAPFANANYPAFLAIENSATDIWGGSNIYYHGPYDASDSTAGLHYDYGFATDVVRAVVATYAQEAQPVLAVSAWQIVVDHAAGGHIATTIGSSYVEPRAAATSSLRAVFQRAIDPATLAPGAVTIVGQTAGNVSSLITGLSLDSSGAVLTIDLSAPLPDADWYTVTVASSVHDTYGLETSGPGRTLVIGCLAGDLDGSGQVDGADVLLARDALGESLALSAGFDVNRSGAITAADMRDVVHRIGRSLPTLVTASAAEPAVAAAPIDIRLQASDTWLYAVAGTPAGAAHRVSIRVEVVADPSANAAFDTALAAVDAASTSGRVTILPTADPMVWDILGETPGDVTLRATAAGRDAGGQGEATFRLTVRPLGDLDGDGFVTDADATELTHALNGWQAPGLRRAADLNGDSAVTTADRLLMTRLLSAAE